MAAPWQEAQASLESLRDLLGTCQNAWGPAEGGEVRLHCDADEANRFAASSGLIRTPRCPIRYRPQPASAWQPGRSRGSLAGRSCCRCGCCWRRRRRACQLRFCLRRDTPPRLTCTTSPAQALSAQLRALQQACVQWEDGVQTASAGCAGWRMRTRMQPQQHRLLTSSVLTCCAARLRTCLQP